MFQATATSPNEIQLQWALNVADPLRLTLSRFGENLVDLSAEDGRYIDTHLAPNTSYQYLLTLELANGTRSFHRTQLATLAVPPKLSRQMATHSTGFQIPIVDDVNPDYTEYQVILTDTFGTRHAVTDWSTSRCQTFDNLEFPSYFMRVFARNLDGVTTTAANQYAEDFRGPGLTATVGVPRVYRWWQSGGTQDPWVKGRIRDTALVFGLTDKAAEWMNDDILIDWRRGQPGYAGYYNGYVGVGHSFLGAMMHETMHAFWEHWDGFIESCDQMNVYTFRRDIAEFALEFRHLERSDSNHHLAAWRPYYNLIEGLMASEPLEEEYWEVLERGEYGKFDGLWHLLETTIPGYNPHHSTLIPPRLQKYFKGFLKDGEYWTWEEELNWYIALEDEDRRLWSVFNTHDMHYYSPNPPDYPARTRIEEPLRSMLRSTDRQMVVDFINTLEDHTPWEWWVDSRGFWTSYLETHLSRVPVYKAELNSEIGIELEQPNLDAVLEAMQLLFDLHCQLGEFCSFIHGTDIHFIREQTRAAIGSLEPLSEKQRAILLAMIDMR